MESLSPATQEWLRNLARAEVLRPRWSRIVPFQIIGLCLVLEFAPGSRLFIGGVFLMGGNLLYELVYKQLRRQFIQRQL